MENANTTRYGQPGFASAAFRQALSNGSVPMSRLDDMALRILTPMYALGLVDDPPRPVLRLFPACALISHAQGSSGVVDTMLFAWRGHTKSRTTARAGRALELALRLG